MVLFSYCWFFAGEINYIDMIECSFIAETFKDESRILASLTKLKNIFFYSSNTSVEINYSSNTFAEINERWYIGSSY